MNSVSPVSTAYGVAASFARSYTTIEIDSGECPGVSSTDSRTSPNSTASPSPSGVNGYSAEAALPR